jgi:hypothetical protein
MQSIMIEAKHTWRLTLGNAFVIWYAIYNKIGKLPLHHTTLYATAGDTLSLSTIIAPASLQYILYIHIHPTICIHNIFRFSKIEYTFFNYFKSR